MQRVGWIDFLRGISMILILVFHTEVYYKEYDVTPCSILFLATYSIVQKCSV